MRTIIAPSKLLRISRYVRESLFFRGLVVGWVSLLVAQLCYTTATSKPPSATETGEFRPNFQDFVRQSQLLHERPRILCMVMTQPENYLTKAVHVAATWAGRCHQVVFLSSQSIFSPIFRTKLPGAKSDLPLLEAPLVNSRATLWQKLKYGLVKVWEKHKNDFDFLLKADDDTYIVMENLVDFLTEFNSSEPIYLGHQQVDVGINYMSGGSGYVLSHEAVKRIVEVGLKGERGPPATPSPVDTSSSLCHFPYPHGTELELMPSEDLQLGGCAKLLNIRLVPSNWKGLSTFFPFRLETYLVPDLQHKWSFSHSRECGQSYRVSSELANRGSSITWCVSDKPIAFHYVQPVEMYTYDYLIHRVGANIPRAS